MTSAPSTAESVRRILVGAIPLSVLFCCERKAEGNDIGVLRARLKMIPIQSSLLQQIALNAKANSPRNQANLQLTIQPRQLYIISKDEVLCAHVKRHTAFNSLWVERISDTKSLATLAPCAGCIIFDIKTDPAATLLRLAHVAQNCPWLPILTIGYSVRPQDSASAIKYGAYDFLALPCSDRKLCDTVAVGLKTSVIYLEKYCRRDSFDQRLAQLTPREHEVYQLLLKGWENKQIAFELRITSSTAEKHRLSVVRKMQAGNVVQLLSQKFEATGSLANDLETQEVPLSYAA